MDNIVNVIEIVEEGSTFTLEFRVSNPLRVSYKGKHWPKTTQCLVYANGRLIGFSEVIKHVNDIDNQKLANKLAAKKAFDVTYLKNWKSLRTKFWNKILN